jgi:predicted Zn-dependent protease
MPKFGKSLAALLLCAQAALGNPIVPPPKKLDIDLKEIQEIAVPEPGEDKRLDMNLPEIGDSSQTVFTPQQEKELGAAFFRSLHGELEVSEDPEVGEYIQSIGQKLAARSDTPQQSFHFFVVTDPGINAFAGPGGYIGVNSGLILISESESELASVLGHEIAHVTQRHLYQAIQAAGRLSLPTAAAILAGILIGAKTGNPQAASAAVMAGMAANLQSQINFTRDNEAEADRVGMQILSRSRFDPRAMPTFFERMQQSTRLAGHNLPEFLLTHPVTVSRIADTRGRAERFPYRQYPDSFVYQLIRAKLRVLTAPNPRDAAAYFRNMSDRGDRVQQDANRYGLGLALSMIADRQAEEGKRILQQLALRYPEQSHFVNALANAAMERRDYEGALRIFEAARERFPESRAVALNYAKALLEVKQYEKAHRLLQEYMRAVPPTVQVYEMLAQSYSGLGQEAESHRYLAEAYYADGQTRAAIMQMRIARRFAGDNFYVNAVIDERMKQFMEEEAERRKR